MFCPSCGSAENQSNQFCRACGTDLRTIRTALERPDNITASAVSARDEIGRAVAAKIRQMETAQDLKKIVEEVLPEIEKLLESPAEKRMRRVRQGTVVSGIGLGVAIAFSLFSVAMKEEGVFFLAGLGLVTLFIGLSLLINALLFTVPKNDLSDKSDDAQTQRELDGGAQSTGEFTLPPSKTFASVTEHTTHQLSDKQPLSDN